MSIIGNRPSIDLLDIIGNDPNPGDIFKKKKNKSRERISVVDNIFRDKVKPKKGSVVICDLAFALEHSGIYIGDGLIAHLDGNGRVEAVTPEVFMDRLEGKNNAISVYVSCEDTKPVRKKKAAKRAKEWVGRDRGYNLFDNNCHIFTAYCLTGEEDDSIYTFEDLEALVEYELDSDNWRVWDLED